ncbi:PAN domain protein [Trichinella nativa]|uniref:PAN domain protein n=1 Tax=Trichinella nativa TaxID=6335 RepID=A0A1Y3EGT9_9BILA|nr:PAN domain protein [Trichinella nativa]
MNIRIILLAAFLLQTIHFVVVTSNDRTVQRDCVPVYVRWARVRVGLTAKVSGSHTLGNCMLLCSDEAYPEKPGVELPCAGFNYKYGTSDLTSDCQFFQNDQLRNVDWYAEANDQYAFFRKYCVNTKNACKSTHQFDFYIDRFMDENLIDKQFTAQRLEDCLGACLDETTIHCRSVTYNRTSAMCKLSTHNRLTKPRHVQVNNNPNYRIDYYENNCQNSSVQLTHVCSDKGILVKAESKFPYTGALYGLYDFFTCRVEPHEKTTFSLFFPFPTEGKNCSDSITVEGDNFVLDAVVSMDGVQPLYFVTDQVECPRFNDKAASSSSYPSAVVGTAVDIVPSSKRTGTVVQTEQPIQFDILHNGQNVKAVVIGSKITLQFTPTYSSLRTNNLILVACQIEPVNSPYAWERDPLQIIRNGCQADGVGLVCPPESSFSGVKVSMEAFRYTTTSEVLFSCLVRNCNFGPCHRPICPAVEGCSDSGSILPTSDIQPQNVPMQTMGTSSSSTTTKDSFTFTEGDHVVSRQLVVVNSVHELQYFMKTGNVPSGIQNPGFFHG